MTAQQLLARLEGVKPAGDQKWMARCPCPIHGRGDRKPSLSIAVGKEGLLLTCHAGGDTPSVVSALGLRMKDLFFPGATSATRSSTETVYSYRDEHGTLLYQVVRHDHPSGKKIFQRRPDPARPGNWITKLGDARRVLYRLPELISAAPDAVVFVVEGEKNVDDLVLRGLVATTNPQGAGKWRKDFNVFLHGRVVVVIPDNDAPGRAHAEGVAAQLEGTAALVKVLELAGLPEKGDVSDWLSAGGTAGELLELAAQCAPWSRRENAKPASGTAPEEAGGNGPPRQNQAQLLIALAQENVQFFRSEDDDEAYATFHHDGRQITCEVASRMFHAFLVKLHLDALGRPPSSANVTEAANILDTMSVFGAARAPVWLRVGEHSGRLYLDLGDDSGRLVEIGANGWTIKEAGEVPGVRFRRSRITRSLPAPVPGGSTDELRAFLNCGSEDEWRLIVPFLLFCMQPRGPFPLIVVQGEQSSAKTTTTQVLRKLVDPAQYPILRFRGQPDDLFHFAKHSWLLALDNLSGLSRDTSDALCGLSTGTGDARRKLYTDGDLHGFNGFRPVILNGIDDMATRADLARRAITLKLPPIEKGRRRGPTEFWTAFERAHPRILGALLTALSDTIRLLPGVHLAESSSMADFERFGVAVERALGWPSRAFLSAYRSNQRQTEAAAIEGDAVASAIEDKLLEKWEGRWEGDMQDLLGELNAIVPIGFRDRSWPTSPRHLASQLERAKPLLRPRGVSIYRAPRTKEKRPWVIERTQTQPESQALETVTTVTASFDQKLPALGGDDRGDCRAGDDGVPFRESDGDDVTPRDPADRHPPFSLDG